MIPAKETAHVAVGLKLLIEQFRNADAVNHVLTSHLDSFQDLENVLWDVINSRFLDTAVGVQLDILGGLVGERRGAANDVDFRSAIRLRIRVNRSQGLAEDVIQVGTLVTGAALDYQEYGSGSFLVQLLNATSPIVVARMLASVKAAGTRGVLVYTNWTPSDDVFTWDDAVTPIAGNVWSDVSTASEVWPAAIELSLPIVDRASPLIAPVVTGITPNIGLTLAAGTPVTITGSNFLHTDTVMIDGVPCTSVAYVDDHTLTAVTGTLTTEGQKDVTVTHTDTQFGSFVGGYFAFASTMWLRSRPGDYVLDASSKVATATDKSGTGNSMVSTGVNAGPPVDATGMNGQPAFRWTASSQYLAKAGFSGPSAGEMFIVKKNNIGATGYGLWYMGSSNVSDLHPYTADGVIYDDGGSTVRKATAAPAVSLNYPHIYNFSSTAGAWTNYVNGVQVFTTATNTVGWASQIEIGRTNTPLAGFDGWVSEVIMFSRVLTAPERAAVNAYLTSQWSIVNNAPQPYITTITPNVGHSLTAAATAPYLLTITGVNFVSGATILIDGIAAGSPAFVNSTTLTCYQPTLGAVGVKDVKVTNPDGQYHVLTGVYRATQAKLWARADDAASSITSWKDLSGNANHSTAGHASSLNTTGVGGKHAFVLVPGSSDYFRFPCAFNSASSTVFIVGQYTANVTGNEGVFVLLGSGSVADNANASSSVVFRGNPGGNTMTDFKNLVTESTLVGPSNGIDFAFWHEFDGTNSKMKVNGTTATPVGATGSMNVAEFILGSRYLASTVQLFQPLRAAEVLVYSPALSTADYNAVVARLNARYATTL